MQTNFFFVYRHGQWFAPKYQCDYNGILPRDWIITYSVPFFGKDQFGTGLEFRGVVRVDVKLDELDINQCYKPYYEANAFKNSDRCDYYSTLCVPTPGRVLLRAATSVSAELVLSIHFWIRTISTQVIS